MSIREQYVIAQREKKYQKIKNDIEEKLISYNVELIKIEENEESLSVDYNYTIDGVKNIDRNYWHYDEELDELLYKIKRHLDYIKKIRENFPLYAKQNDFIQKNRHYEKELVLTEMGYERKHTFRLDLCSYLKLPNTTSNSFGGGDYEIKRTPQRVKEYNENIDKTVMFLIDMISELNTLKCNIDNDDIDKE